MVKFKVGQVIKRHFTTINSYNIGVITELRPKGANYTCMWNSGGEDHNISTYFSYTSAFKTTILADKLTPAIKVLYVK